MGPSVFYIVIPCYYVGVLLALCGEEEAFYITVIMSQSFSEPVPLDADLHSASWIFIPS